MGFSKTLPIDCTPVLKAVINKALGTDENGKVKFTVENDTALNDRSQRVGSDRKKDRAESPTNNRL